MAERRKGVSA